MITDASHTAPTARFDKTYDVRGPMTRRRFTGTLYAPPHVATAELKRQGSYAAYWQGSGFLIGPDDQFEVLTYVTDPDYRGSQHPPKLGVAIEDLISAILDEDAESPLRTDPDARSEALIRTVQNAYGAIESDAGIIVPRRTRLLGPDTYSS